MTTIKERPILFSAEMVRAILEGHKTQTRRIVKDKHFDLSNYDFRYLYDKPDGVLQAAFRNKKHEDHFLSMPCPYGQPGDRLWVRETWAKTSVCPIVETINNQMTVYRACDNRTDYGGPWKPSIHMPRSASRITLEITGIRVERLGDITVKDSIKEGIGRNDYAWENYLASENNPQRFGLIPQDSFASLWKSINGPDSWAPNPWVWVIEFRRIRP